MTLRSILIIFLSLGALSLGACGKPDEGRHRVQAVAGESVDGARAQSDNPAYVAAPELDIPFYKEKLENGLTVIVHEDHKAPVVAVNIWYKVGSKDEVPGKTGFAHLFEHLMFNGSENYPGEYFEPFQRSGATDMNGTTNNDRTNYFETVPTGALDMALWMESDRMGHFVGAITQETLDEQRGVVKNEKRQRENTPYGQAFERIASGTFPPYHPYSWTTIGSMEDLDNASLEDVKQWFRDYYQPANAILVIAGDITVEEAMAKARQYFGNIPSSGVQPRLKNWELPVQPNKREEMFDQVPQTRIYKVWNVPAVGSEEEDALDLITSLLANRKNSLLYRRLVRDEQLATSVSAFYYGRQLAGQLMIIVDVKPGQSVEKVEAVLDESLWAFVNNGVDARELRRIKQSEFASLVKGLEKIGGFGGKSDILAQSEFYYGDPGALIEGLQHYAGVSAQEVQAVAARWLTPESYTLIIRPREKYATSEKKVDRSRLPPVDKKVELELPKQESFTLDNGLKVVLAERHDTPVVLMNLQFKSGAAADGDKPGLASMAASMLSEGAGDLDALAFSARQEELGASIGTGSGLDYNNITLSALKNQLDPSLELFAKVVLEPLFPEKDLARVKSNRLDAIAQEKAQPQGLALRTLPPLLFGDKHPYGAPLTGSGTVEGIEAIERDDLVRFHNTWVRPDNAVLIVVGDVTREEIQASLNRALADWRAPKTELARIEVPTVERPQKTRIYLVDRPGAEQSYIMAGLVMPPWQPQGAEAFEAMAAVIAGKFTSRVNMNLREDKHWTYGARAVSLDTEGQRPYILFAPVQTDKTAPAILELLKEYRSFLGDKPVTERELADYRDDEVLKQSARFQTKGQLLSSIAWQVEKGLPPEYISEYPQRVEVLTVDEVESSARQFLQPDQFTWVIIGDLSRIQKEVEALNIGPVEVLSPGD
ncbi:M16 family metallopeptidase [Microbulbifer thermotolerans]|uniref:Insulinase family protein n=1 Tax=Microbulbifer thermotolerans TaxID=252514 RepID=A0AB35HXC9_MICTH|nr:pitrilysin family protein [Microbulbifer thermotolerans]MCX2780043.1 insulinase family protein [Microbulbifer thermotolerans]MCX2801870.1 insulinase family protein [Microbulbifer thermotolerans]MCX2805466.1 insulinase family protein [Microbulbifer thermotolerans]